MTAYSPRHKPRRHGRHARRGRLPRRVLGMALSTLLALVAGWFVNAPAANADYNESRYRDGNTVICVQWGHLDKAKSKWAVKKAARAWRDNLDNVNLRIREWCGNSAQKIVAHDWWKKEGYVGFWFPGKKTWAQVPTAGPWTNNGWTNTYTKSKVVLYLGNLRGKSDRYWLWVASHEIGHALGLEHQTHHANSVMWSSYSSKRPALPKWWDVTGQWGTNRPGVDKIFGQG